MPSQNNALQGDFGEAWLEAVAAGCGFLHGRPASLDLEKADVQLTLLGRHQGTFNPTVKVQVKTEVEPRTDTDGTLVYNLDVPTYDVLRRQDHAVRRVLAVIGLSAEGPRVKLSDDGTILVGRGAWVSLEGYPVSPNSTSQVIRLPVANTLGQAGLDRMLKTHGVTRPTPVPDADPWGDAEMSKEGRQ
ncbi:MAG: hypothetical protein JWM19_3139 [Actinomycetia bacterium]|nr:hypothetical protein [Actinomycetes bacterium]